MLVLEKETGSYITRSYTTPYVLSRMAQCLDQSFIGVTVVMYNHSTNHIKCLAGNLRIKENDINVNEANYNNNTLLKQTVTS